MAKAIAIYLGGKDRLIATALKGSGKGLEMTAIGEDGMAWCRYQQFPAMRIGWSVWQATHTTFDIKNLPDSIDDCYRVFADDGSVESHLLFDGAKIKVRLPA